MRLRKLLRWDQLFFWRFTRPTPTVDAWLRFPVYFSGLHRHCLPLEEWLRCFTPRFFRFIVDLNWELLLLCRCNEMFFFLLAFNRMMFGLFHHRLRKCLSQSLVPERCFIYSRLRDFRNHLAVVFLLQLIYVFINCQLTNSFFPLF